MLNADSRMTTDSLTASPLARQQQLISQIATGIASDTPEPWDVIAYRTKVLLPYEQDLSYVTRPDGEIHRSLPPDEISELVSELRELMYRPNSGTWFTFSLTIRRAGGVDAAFDYDSKPEWSHPAEAVFYVQDLERFPRDDDHIPQWLVDELVRGRAQDLEYDKTEGQRKRIRPITEER